MAFNITPPLNIINRFGYWLNGVPKKAKAHIRVGVCAILWVLKVKNDCIFNKKEFHIISAGYSFGNSLYPYVILSTVGG
jgi:hypothetical protein